MKIRFKIKNSTIFNDWKYIDIDDEIALMDISKAIDNYCNEFLGVINKRNLSSISWEPVIDRLKKVA